MMKGYFMSLSFSFPPRGRFMPWVFMLALMLCACGQSPEGTVKDYFDAVAENRVEDAVNFYSLKDVKENDLTMAKGKLQMIVGEQYSRIGENGGLESVKTKLVEQKDDEAKVEVEISYKNGQTSTDQIQLTKESGRWKLYLK
jgi:hypothetical protein